MTRLLVIVSAVLSLSTSIAQEATIVHANGMNTDKEGAIENRIALEELLEDRLSSSEFSQLQFANAFNQHQSFFRQILLARSYLSLEECIKAQIKWMESFCSSNRL